MSSAHWFISINGEAKGPLTEDKIRELLADNLIDEHSSVWSSESASDAWQPLFRSELRHLMAGKAVRPPPLPGQQAGSSAAPLDGPKTADAIGPAPPSPPPKPVSHADSLGADRPGRDTTSSPRGSATGLSQTRTLAQFLLLLGMVGAFGLTSFSFISSLLVDRVVERDGLTAGLRASEWLEALSPEWLLFLSFLGFPIAFTWWLASETAALVEEQNTERAAPSGSLPSWAVWLTILPGIGALVAVPFLRSIVTATVRERQYRANSSVVIWAITATLASIENFVTGIFIMLRAEHPYYCLGEIDERNLEYCNGVGPIPDMLLWFSIVALFWIILSVRRGIGYDPMFMWVFDKKR